MFANGRHTQIRPGIIILLLVPLLATLVACRNTTPTPEPSPTPIPISDTADNGLPAQPQPSVTITHYLVVTATPAVAPEATPTPIPPTGTLVLWHSLAQTDGDALAAILRQLQQRFPGITIETLFVSHNDLLQSYAEAVQNGGGPDLVIAPNWWLGDMVNVGVVQPLSQIVPADQLSGYVPAAMDSMRWQGELYGLPIDFNTVALYYNRALLSPDRVPTTTDQMLELARQAPTQGVGLYANLFHLYWGIPAYGGQLLDNEGRVILDQTGNVPGFLEWLIVINDTPGSFVDLDYGMLLDRFKKGEYAMLVDGLWARDELEAALGSNLAVAPLPAGPDGAAQPWLYADGIFLNPNQPRTQQELALFVAQQLTNADSGSLIAQIGGRLPAYRSAKTGTDPIIQGFVQQAVSAQPMPTIREMENVTGYGGDMIIKALSGTGEPAAIVAETATLINEANLK